jgi:hypothetical protein
MRLSAQSREDRVMKMAVEIYEESGKKVEASQSGWETSS